VVTAVATFYVEGDTYDEILDRGIDLVSRLLGIPQDDVLDRANMEFNIVENEPLESDMAYAAEMIARLKNVR
jgi:hypothetical protein